MELRHLRYFVAVAEELNFRKAAERLNVSQPPLSKQIMDLEYEIGHPLFFRTNRSVSLTDAGEVFLIRARKILKDSDDAKKDIWLAAEGYLGTLSIFFAPSVAAGYLNKVLGEYKSKYPDVKIELKQSTSSNMPDQLIRGEMDVGLVRLPIEVPNSIFLQPLTKESFVVALPCDHDLVHLKEVSFQELKNQKIISTPREASPYYYDCIMSLFSKYDVVPYIKQEAVEQFTISALVSSFKLFQASINST